jgi:small-conductance mechanosensitive channel
MSLAMLLLIFGLAAFGQSDEAVQKPDSVLRVEGAQGLQRADDIAMQRMADSIKLSQLEALVLKLQTAKPDEHNELIEELKAVDENEVKQIADKIQRIEALRSTTTGYPVIGPSKDTLFFIYTKMGASSPKERAANCSRKIGILYDDEFLIPDSIVVVKSENTYDIVYGEMIAMSISENDAIWYGKGMPETAESIKELIKNSIVSAREDNSLMKILFRIGLVLLVILIAWMLFRFVRIGHSRLQAFIASKKDKWLKNLSYKDYTFLSADQELQVILFLIKILRWLFYAILLYVTLPIIFSIFPFSRDWADALFHLVWSPFKGLLLSLWNYLPNLFSILVIFFVMRYVIRFVRYIFHEIEIEKLKISGFHADWAMPTYSIVRFLLYAFMFVLIFPYLPGSDSDIFKGVSVFIGILFSLGSSTAIANMVAGLVITYMRPFKIGDRIRIADVSGDVIEKTLLVTRIMTTKNEVITIPNSSVLNGNTTNYSIEAKQNGLIIHTTVTIGYDVPWKDMHQALIDAALKTDMILHEPKPFVLQTGLEDFYVAYQINAYTREASRQALIYSSLHQNIQDVCNERGIEILSPHYRAARDGNMTTIPANYLPVDYVAPKFGVNMGKEEGATK